MQTIQTNILIIGGGVSGLFTAFLCEQKNSSVTLVDHQKTLGMKWSLAGGAMGNMTNRTISTDHYVSSSPKQAQKLLNSLFKTWKTEDVLAFMQNLSMDYEEREYGQIFCKKPVKYLIEALIQKLRKTQILTDEKIQTYYYQENTDTSSYVIKTEHYEIHAQNLVIATGSTSYPQAGATDFALRLAKKWGHTFFPFRSALAPLVLPEHSPLLGLEGISIPVRLKVLHKNEQNTIIEKKDPCDIRSLLFTHTGISGPAALVISCLWEQNDCIEIDFLPRENLLEKMHNSANGKKLVKNLILSLMPDRLAYALMPRNLQERKIAELSKKDRQKLITSFHHYQFIPKNVDSLKKAEACLGGVALAEISVNLESTLRKNLYFAGECLDITGLLGGYNIHFALACAKRIASRIQ